LKKGAVRNEVCGLRQSVGGREEGGRNHSFGLGVKGKISNAPKTSSGGNVGLKEGERFCDYAAWEGYLRHGVVAGNLQQGLPM